MSEPNVLGLLIGAFLAVFGGVTTQVFVSYLTKKDARKTLIAGLSGELKVLREDINTHIAGIRDTLKDGKQLPRPDGLSVSTVVFDASAGVLGTLKEPDLIENVVEVYSIVHHLIGEAKRFTGTPNTALIPREIHYYHFDASMAQLEVMKLHNRLTRGNDCGPHNLYDQEAETRQLKEKWAVQNSDRPGDIDFTYSLNA